MNEEEEGEEEKEEVDKEEKEEEASRDAHCWMQRRQFGGGKKSK